MTPNEQQIVTVAETIAAVIKERDALRIANADLKGLLLLAIVSAGSCDGIEVDTP